MGIQEHCSKCPEPLYRRVQANRYCVKHYRFRQMRSGAGERGKAVPSVEELELMLLRLGLFCPGCGTTMTFTAPSNDRRHLMTLQHDRSGQMRLLCYSCNSRHPHMPGDLFYSKTAYTKWCNGCSQFRAVRDFAKHPSRISGLATRCRSCGNRKYSLVNARTVPEGSCAV